eukprot:TRINITY_DN8831_c0_g1_i1.p1 TRINITY_DN8831_c0_g1~~TRINITY_DN8831_c0_g1_i1.p1  ORF type:complete len:245 (+),score=18.85 TRINITY_DN8831_c0_g1_i1:64-798(+)
MCIRDRFFYITQRIPVFNEVGFPTSFEKAKTIANELSSSLSTHYMDLLLFHVSSFLFLQTWCIPGTFVFNLLGGAMFGSFLGFLICLCCNTVGAFFAYSLSKIFLQDVVEARFHRHVNFMAKKVEENRSDLFFFMVSTRIFPGSPNWLMNLTFPHIPTIPTTYFICSIALGLIPWNFLTCQAGEIISHIKSKDDVIQASTYFKLILLALGLLIPPILRRFLCKNKKEIDYEQVELSPHSGPHLP